MNLLRKLMALCGAKYVVLTDTDGDKNIRRVRWSGTGYVADRVGFGIRTVGLLDGGDVSNGAYVMRWEPFDPLARRRPLPFHKMGWGRSHA